MFAGDHPVGGERHSREAVARWFARLHRLFELRFDVSRVSVSGPIEIRRGKVTHFHAYEDSQKVAEACRRMAEAGIEEAAAPQTTDGGEGTERRYRCSS